MSSTRSLGAQAEDRAAAYLQEQGFTIITRRFKTIRGEIDIVALDGEVLVFIEVKHRGNSASVPELAIREAKVRSVVDAAARYVAQMEQTNRQVRFDVVAITPTEIRHHRDVFGN